MANIYAITGATGNIGRLVTEKLLTEGHHVRAVARTAENLQTLADKGADTHPGFEEDTAFFNRSLPEG